MKKIFGSTVLVVAVGLVATAAHAAEFWSSNSSLKVTDISVESPSDTSGPRVYVKFSSTGLGFTHGCSVTDGWWIVGGNSAGVERAHAQLLSARLAERNVSIKWDNAGISGATGNQISCAGAGQAVGHPVLRGLIVK